MAERRGSPRPGAIQQCLATGPATVPPAQQHKGSKVAIFVEPSPFSHVSGMKNRFECLIKGLRQEGDEVLVVTPDPKPPKEFCGAKVNGTACEGAMLACMQLKAHALFLMRFCSRPSACSTSALDVVQRVCLAVHDGLQRFMRHTQYVPGRLSSVRVACITVKAHPGHLNGPPHPSHAISSASTSLTNPLRAASQLQNILLNLLPDLTLCQHSFCINNQDYESVERTHVHLICISISQGPCATFPCPFTLSLRC